MIIFIFGFPLVSVVRKIKKIILLLVYDEDIRKCTFSVVDNDR